MTLRTISPDEAKSLLESAARPQLVDVRQPAEYAQGHLPGALLLPLTELTERAGELDQARPVLAYCHSGMRSHAAAGLLAGLGFGEVANLEGGMMAWEGQVAVGDTVQGLDFFAADAAPLDVLALAYVMEDNLGRFYARLAEKSPLGPLQELFRRLSGYEEGHKAMVLRLARQMDPELKDPAPLVARAAGSTGAGMLEGGLESGAFLAENAEQLKTPYWALDTAMAVEAQALDLYTRLAGRLTQPEAVRQAKALADEELRHLRALGRLLEATPA